jgi:hypothetical protein
MYALSEKPFRGEKNLAGDSARVHIVEIPITKYEVNNRSIVLIFLTAPLS